jgi:branched-subunit amino acid aminotransferase/4-amino-4-deoxychorismate lyase
MRLPTYVLRSGELVLPAQASISVFNPAIYGAFGVYESIQVAGGVVFAQEAHLQRLARSAEILGLPLPVDLSTFGRWIAQVLQVHAATDCTLRLLVVGEQEGSKATTFIWPQPATVYPASFYLHGVPAITFEGERYLPQAKSLNMLVTFLARRQAQAAGAHEALLHYEGRLTEGSNSNLFAVIEGEVLTPPATQVLSGVTRDFLISLAREQGIMIREATLTLAEAPRWSECFITSTSRHVMPVTAIDAQPIGSGQVGPFSRRLAAVFDEYFYRQCTKNTLA